MEKKIRAIRELQHNLDPYLNNNAESEHPHSNNDGNQLKIETKKLTKTHYLNKSRRVDLWNEFSLTRGNSISNEVKVNSCQSVPLSFDCQKEDKNTSDDLEIQKLTVIEEQVDCYNEEEELPVIDDIEKYFDDIEKYIGDFDKYINAPEQVHQNTKTHEICPVVKDIEKCTNNDQQQLDPGSVNKLCPVGEDIDKCTNISQEQVDANDLTQGLCYVFKDIDIIQQKIHSNSTTQQDPLSLHSTEYEDSIIVDYKTYLMRDQHNKTISFDDSIKDQNFTDDVHLIKDEDLNKNLISLPTSIANALKTKDCHISLNDIFVQNRQPNPQTNMTFNIGCNNTDDLPLPKGGESVALSIVDFNDEMSPFISDGNHVLMDNALDVNLCAMITSPELDDVAKQLVQYMENGGVGITNILNNEENDNNRLPISNSQYPCDQKRISTPQCDLTLKSGAGQPLDLSIKEITPSSSDGNFDNDISLKDQAPSLQDAYHMINESRSIENNWYVDNVKELVTPEMNNNTDESERNLVQLSKYKFDRNGNYSKDCFKRNKSLQHRTTDILSQKTSTNSCISTSGFSKKEDSDATKQKKASSKKRKLLENKFSIPKKKRISTNSNIKYTLELVESQQAINKKDSINHSQTLSTNHQKYNLVYDFSTDLDYEPSKSGFRV